MTATQPPASLPSRILLVGNPNVGKSVIFNLLTGSYAVVSNYPGTTVQVTRGRMRGLGKRPEVIDTPGTNSLIPLSVDEMVTRDIILNEQDYVVLQVVDARNLTRGLRITAQLAELGVPVVIALNMMDEATAEGINIASEKLSDILGVDVVPTVATERRGIAELSQAVRRARRPRFTVRYAPEIERAVQQISDLLPELRLDKRGIALMLLQGDSGVLDWLSRHAPTEVLERVIAQVQACRQELGSDVDYAIASQAWQQCEHVAESVTARRPVSVSRFRQLLSSATMHPLWGTLILVFVLYLMYVVVGKFGAGTVAEWFSGTVMGSPPDTVMALGDPKAPATIEKATAASRLPEGPVVLNPVAAGNAYEARVAPGEGCQLFLRPQSRYSLTGRLRVEGDTVPRVSVVVAYSDRRQEEFVAALTPTTRASEYLLSCRVRPSFEGGRYVVVVRLSRPSPLTLYELRFLRDAEGAVTPWLYDLVIKYAPTEFFRYLLVGQYGVITMGLKLAIGVVLPIVTFFFLFFALVEDSGYLARLTVLANRVFRVMGLNGRAAVPMVLGLGCDTMATLATRILDTGKARLIVIFLLALGVPCSAQLGVIMGIWAWPAISALKPCSSFSASS
ncbi:MAG: ferrous iron transporter B [Armatimonadetes bacterium]|nr:ferrous iron transporter B [Armatimonadota bacterium]